MAEIQARFGKHTGGTKFYVLIRNTGGNNADYGFCIWGGRGKVATITTYGRERFTAMEAEKRHRDYDFSSVNIGFTNPDIGPGEVAIKLGFKCAETGKGFAEYYAGAAGKFKDFLTRVCGADDLGGLNSIMPKAAEPSPQLRKVALAEKAAQVTPDWGCF